MSTAPKGYPCSQKLERVPAEYASVIPVSANQHGLSVAASLYVFQVGTDAVDAGTTTSKIVAAGIGAVARKGDIIKFTSGAMDGYEVSVIETSTNYVIVGEDMATAPAALDTFTIFRFIRPVATSGGGVAAALSYTLNGVSTAVTEDTVTPANNRPLPVKISGVTMANPPIRNVYSVTPVTTGAYVEMVASLTATAQKIQIFDSSGETLIFAVGAAGAENPIFYISPGGIDICVNIVAGSRIAIKALSANATVGEIVMNITT